MTEKKLEFLSEAGEAGELNVHSTGGSSPPPPPTSDFVIEQDLWSERKGREVLESSPVLRKVYDLDSADAPAQATGAAINAVTDFFTAAFEIDPRLEEHPGDKRRSEFCKTLFETEEFHSLRRRTVLNEFPAMIATRVFSEKWVEIVSRPAPPQADGRADPGDGDPQPGRRPLDIDSLKDAADALDQIDKEVQDFEDAEKAIGSGLGPDNGMGLDEIAVLYKRIKNSTNLKEICARAGAYRLCAAGLQESKIIHGRDEIVGVEPGGDPERLLPSELLAICDPLTEDDAMRRLVEAQSMSYAMQGTKKLGHGPLVMVIDESASMRGEAIWTAKAMALAIYWVARKTSRYCVLVAFSGSREGRYCVMPPTGGHESELLEWLEGFLGGGTCMDVMLSEMPSKWVELGVPEGKTGVICLTDACVEPDPAQVESFNEWREANNVKVQTIVLDARGRGGDSLDCVSDVVHHVTNLSIENDAIQEVLSI